MKKTWLLLLLACLPGCERHRGKVSIINQSQEAVARVYIAVCHQEIRLGEIAPLARAEAEFRVTGDSHYHVEVGFRSGKQLSADLGYITNGMDYEDEILVRDNLLVMKGERTSAQQH